MFRSPTVTRAATAVCAAVLASIVPPLAATQPVAADSTADMHVFRFVPT